VGDDVGNNDGFFEGKLEGINVGSSEGITVGDVVGIKEGVFEGNCVGIELGNWLVDCASAPVIISGKQYKLTAAENIIHFFMFLQRLSTVNVCSSRLW